MLNGDRRIFGLPCRFPARFSIFALCRAQVYDRRRFFAARRSSEKILPEFSLCGRERERRRCPSAQRRGDVAAVGSWPLGGYAGTAAACAMTAGGKSRKWQAT